MAEREADPTPDELERVARVLDRFESAWRRGDQPRITDFASPSDVLLLRNLLGVELELRRQSGDSPRATESIAERADEVRDTLEDVSTVAWPGTLHGSSGPAGDALPSTEAAEMPRATGAPPTVPGCRIDSVIQRGAMGVVYKAWQVGLGRNVAIKSILPGASHDRFEREARLIARISSPHVVAIHDLHPLRGGGHALVMEYVEGTDLARVIKARGGPLDEAETLPWMRQVAEGMRAAADASVIHRDLKPSNILIDARGRARVADFGLGRGPDDLGSTLTRADDVLGTPYYMAPEQAEDPQGVDTRADVYSFGATFYHALTGVPPFEGRSFFSVLFKHKTEPLVSPRSRNPELSEHTSQLLERCLAKNPGDRFPSFAEVSRQLGGKGPLPSPWDPLDDEKLERFLEEYRAKRPRYLSDAFPLGETDTFAFPGGRTLSIRRGDITEEEVEALVSSDDETISMGGGVSRAIRLAGGHDIVDQARRYARVRPGRVVVTSGGELPARFVFHAVTISFENWGMVLPSRDLIAEIVASCLYHADTLDIRSIALPLLGTGVGGFSRDVCLDTLARSLARPLLHGLTCVEHARIVIHP